MNINTGKTILTKLQKIHKYDQDLLLAKSMMWGVRTKKEAAKAENSRRIRSEKQQDKIDTEYIIERKKRIGI